MNKKKRTLFKAAVLGFTAIATSLTIGMSTACAKSDGGSTSSDKEDDKTTTKIDEQTIKNGNFEFYSDNKGLYPISNPDNWTKGTSGSTSSSMSGVIDTGKERWDYITDENLPKTLEDNDDLDSTSDDKKDYNGALTDDLPYKNPHLATDDSSTDEHAKDYIENPFTHKYRYDADGKIIDRAGNEVTTYENEDGELFLDEEFKTPLETSVLMLHNYRSNDYHGTETYYTSSTTVSLEANTAAEISLWVKTTELYYGAADKNRNPVTFDRGAYIKVNTQVGGNSLDAFEIKNINTEQLVETPKKLVDEKEVIDYENWDDNGWVKYTVYVAASSFATTNVNIVLGLGENESNTVEGYAFFDDISITKYDNVADMQAACTAGWNNVIHEKVDDTDPDSNVSYPLAPDAKNEFRTDIRKVQTEDTEGGNIVTEKVYEYNFADRHFFIDFANSAFKSTSAINLRTDNVTAGLTVDDTDTGKYVCTKYDDTTNKYHTNLDPVDYTGTYIPSGLRTNGLDINSDILATTTVKSEEGWSFDGQFGSATEYNDILTPALKTATQLPGANGLQTDALVMLSAYGAAYEAHITDASFTLADGQYMLVSFWIKTADMNGNTAATVTAKGLDGDKDITSTSFTVDSTAYEKVTIGEDEDAYKGWVRCFVRVANTSNDKTTNKQFEIVVNFGNTSIRSTDKSSYNAGWVALTNFSAMELDKDVYDYTSGLAQTTSLEFTEKVEEPSHKFDTEEGSKNEIKTDLATPASYKGVNGASATVKLNNSPDSVKDLSGYHDTNKNNFAGLLSKDNVENYKDKSWYTALSAIEADKLAANGGDLWDAVFGERSLQPLLIVNSERSFGDEAAKRYNYGYIGSSQSVSANGYKAVSVKVKASEGAIANVYLVEDKDGGEVLSYETPRYNFWYDADGNILKGEPEKNSTSADNIAYNLRTDGLYAKNGDADGKLYANFFNLTKYYDEYDPAFEQALYYNDKGEAVSFDKEVIKNQGKDYYADAAKTAYAPHYLIAGGKDNNKVYLYSGEGLGENATYYYVENGKANKSKLVHAVDTSVAALRYAVEDSGTISTPYQFTINTVDNPEYAGKWITVTFYIHAGAETKNYKLELWSGTRDEVSAYESASADSYVVFDYSDLGSSLNQTTFDNLVNGYSDDIIAEYKKLIDDDKLEDNDATITDLKNLHGEKLDFYAYEADYYTFSLYDSAAFIPFNGEINTDETGYQFNYTDSKESLAFLKVVDDGLPYGTADKTEAEYTMSAFIDYSVIDKDVKIIGEPTAPGTDDTPSETTSSEDSVNVWLLASSIVLVVAIFVAIAAIFIRDFIKKRKGRKSSSKNSYNFNKNKRYVRKYVKANGEAPAIEEGEFDESLMSDKPVEETVEETVEEAPAVEETVEETPAVDKQPAEEANDSPAEAEDEKPEDDGNKDE